MKKIILNHKNNTTRPTIFDDLSITKNGVYLINVSGNLIPIKTVVENYIFPESCKNGFLYSYLKGNSNFESEIEFYDDTVLFGQKDNKLFNPKIDTKEGNISFSLLNCYHQIEEIKNAYKSKTGVDFNKDMKTTLISKDKFKYALLKVNDTIIGSVLFAMNEEGRKYGINFNPDIIEFK